MDDESQKPAKPANESTTIEPLGTPLTPEQRGANTELEHHPTKPHLRPLWKPGQSGNPRGRPKRDGFEKHWRNWEKKNRAELEQLAKKEPTIMVELLRHAYGKAPQIKTSEEIKEAAAAMTREALQLLMGRLDAETQAKVSQAARTLMPAEGDNDGTGDG